MKTLHQIAAALALALTFFAATTASAQFGPVPNNPGHNPGPSAPATNAPLPALQGQWVCQSVNGQQMPAGFMMSFTFIDAQTLLITASANGETEQGEVRYQATPQGQITLFESPNDTQGETGNWKIENNQLILYANNNGIEEYIIFTKA